MLRDLQSFFSIIFLALFLSFAVEPAVNWLAARGWKRGAATGLIFLVVLAAMVLLFALIVPAVINGFKQLISVAPTLMEHLQKWAAKVGIDFSSQKVLDEIKKNADKVIGSAASITGGILGLGASIIGQIFKWATVALFLFYFVAQGPQMRRAVCRRLPPARQQQVLFVWEQAIEKTGGYFYSRLLLAVINGTGMYIVLRIRGVPFAAPLAIFQGVVSEFIPIVGTYIAGVVPVLVALLFSPADALWVLGVHPRLPVPGELRAQPAADGEDDGAASGGGVRGGADRRRARGHPDGVPGRSRQPRSSSRPCTEFSKGYDVIDDALTRSQAEAPKKRRPMGFIPARWRKVAAKEPPGDDPPGG